MKGKNNLFKRSIAGMLAFLMVLTLLPTLTIVQAGDATATMSNQSATITHDGTTTSISEATEASIGDAVAVNFDWSLQDGTLDNPTTVTIDLSSMLYSISLNNVSDHTLYSGDGTAIGTYDITDNKLIMTITDSDFLNQTTRTGKASLDGAIVADSSLYDGDDMTVGFGSATKTLTYDNPSKQRPTSSVYVTKGTDGNAVYENGKYYQQYKSTITVNNGDVVMGDASITNSLVDTPDNGLTNISDITITAVNGASSAGVAVGDTMSFDNLVGKLNGTTLSSGDSISFTYTLEINDGYITGESGYSYNNKITVNYENSKGEYTSTSATAYGVTLGKLSATKSGVLNADGDSITWTIKVDLSALKDAYTSAQAKAMITSVTDTPQAYNGITWWESVSSIAVSDFTETATDSYIYTATVTTPLTDAAATNPAKISLGNKVDVGLTVGDESVTLTNTGYTYTNGYTWSLDKAYKTGSYNATDKTIEWTITVGEFPSGITSASLIDYMRSQSTGTEYIKEVYVKESTEDDSAYVKIAEGTENSLAVASGASSILTSATAPAYSWETANTFVFTSDYLTSVAGKTLVFKIVGQITDDSVSGMTYKNKAEFSYTTAFGSSSLSDEDSINDLDAKQMEKSGTANDGDASADYTIAVYLNDLDLSTDKTFTIKDVPDTDMDIDIDNYTVNVYAGYSQWDGSITYYKKTGDYVNNEVASATATATKDTDGIVTWTVSIGQGVINLCDDSSVNKVKLEIAYTADCTDRDFLVNGGDKEVLNTATVTYNNTDLGTDTSTVSLTAPSLVEKTGTYTKGYTADYEVLVNPKAADIVEGSDTIIGEDVLGSELSHVLSSIKVYKNVSGSWVLTSDFSYSYDSTAGKLSLTLPDETYLKITYQARVNLYTGTDTEAGETFTKSGSTNTFTVKGVTTNNTSGTDFANVQTSHDNVTGDSETATVVLTKFYNDISANVTYVPGAEFEIYTMSIENNKLVTGSKFKDANIIADNGTLSVKELEYDTIYKMVETKAPENCILSDEPTYFYVKGSNHATIESQIEALTDDVDIVACASGVSVYVENVAAGSLQITKTITGTAPSGVASKISFQICDADDEVYKTVNLSDFTLSDGVYTYTLDQIPIGDYTIVENVTAVTGYTCATAYKVGTASTPTSGRTADVTVELGETSKVAYSNAYTSDVPAGTSLTVVKKWTGDYVDNVLETGTEVTVALYKYGDTTAIRTATLNDDNSFSYTFTDLDYDADIEYTVVETSTTPGFEAANEGVAIYDSEKDQYVLTNESIEYQYRERYFVQTLDEVDYGLTINGKNYKWVYSEGYDAYYGEEVTVTDRSKDTSFNFRVDTDTQINNTDFTDYQLVNNPEGYIASDTIKDNNTEVYQFFDLPAYDVNYYLEVDGTEDYYNAAKVVENNGKKFMLSSDIDSDWKSILDTYVYPDTVVDYADFDGVEGVSETIDGATEGTKATGTDKTFTGWTYSSDNTTHADNPNQGGTVKCNSTKVVIDLYYVFDSTDITVKKVWDDNNNEHGLRDASTSVTVELYTGDNINTLSATGTTATLTSANSYTYTFSNLPTNKTYWVKETSNVSGYVPDNTYGSYADYDSTTNTYTLTNVEGSYHYIEKYYVQTLGTDYDVTVNGKNYKLVETSDEIDTYYGAEVWVDDNSSDSTKTFKVDETKQLTSTHYTDYKLIDTPSGYIATDTIEDNSTVLYQFYDLVPYDVNYYLEVKGTEDYYDSAKTVTNGEKTFMLSSDINSSWTSILDTYVYPNTVIDYKEYSGKEGVSETLDNVSAKATGTDKTFTGWTYSGENTTNSDNPNQGGTAKVSADKVIIDLYYILDETPIATSSLKITKAVSGLTTDELSSLKNTLTFTITSTTLDDDRAESVSKTVKLSDFTTDTDGSFYYVLSDIPCGTYKVTETGTSVEGYNLKIATTAGSTTGSSATVTGIAITSDTPGTVKYTNTYTLKPISIPVSKVWVEGNGDTTYRVPVEFGAYDESGNLCGKVTLNESNDWEGEITDLDAYKTYTVREITEVEGYNASDNGEAVADNDGVYTVTNTLKKEIYTYTEKYYVETLDPDDSTVEVDGSIYKLIEEEKEIEAYYGEEVVVDDKSEDEGYTNYKLINTPTGVDENGVPIIDRDNITDNNTILYQFYVLPTYTINYWVEVKDPSGYDDVVTNEGRYFICKTAESMTVKVYPNTGVDYDETDEVEGVIQNYEGTDKKVTDSYKTFDGWTYSDENTTSGDNPYQGGLVVNGSNIIIDLYYILDAEEEETVPEETTTPKETTITPGDPTPSDDIKGGDMRAIIILMAIAAAVVGGSTFVAFRKRKYN